MHRSHSKIRRDADGVMRDACTSIYYLLESDDFSAWNRLDAEEIWCHHLGGDLQFHVLQNDGRLEHWQLGASILKCALPAHTWFAACPPCPGCRVCTE